MEGDILCMKLKKIIKNIKDGGYKDTLIILP